LIHNFNLGQS